MDSIKEKDEVKEMAFDLDSQAVKLDDANISLDILATYIDDLKNAADVSVQDARAQVALTYDQMNFLLNMAQEKIADFNKWQTQIVVKKIKKGSENE